MKIAIVIEGKTEQAFMPALREFIKGRGAPTTAQVRSYPSDGRIAKGQALKRLVDGLLRARADYVIALTDVHTGSPDFADAADAKRKMREWVGTSERFFPHAAQYEFEAWLLPYWPDVQRLAKHNRGVPGRTPELVNHNKPPSVWLTEIFEAGKSGRSYSKVRDAGRILRDNDLTVAANACPELKAFLNTILQLCGGVRLE